MPISIDDFEGADDEPTNAERVVRFLLANRDKAYRATEIADETEVNENSIHPVLKRLRERGLVRHKPPFWAIGAPEHVHEAFVFGSTASFLDEEFGSESREEWLKAADE